jgi:uncharacterized protein (DUF983 family)
VSDDQNAQEVSEPVVEMATCPECGHGYFGAVPETCVQCGALLGTTPTT